MELIPFFIKEAPVAAVVAIVGGIIIKLIEKKLPNTSEEINSHIALRKELREELDSVNEKLVRLQEEVNEWREKYYAQLELTSQLKLEIAVLREQLEGKLTDLSNGCVE